MFTLQVKKTLITVSSLWFWFNTTLVGLVLIFSTFLPPRWCIFGLYICLLRNTQTVIAFVAHSLSKFSKLVCRVKTVDLWSVFLIKGYLAQVQGWFKIFPKMSALIKHFHPKHRLSLDVLKRREIYSHTSSKLRSKLFLKIYNQPLKRNCFARRT